eukprot:COSAG04_NODE_31923_length_254_cov_0.664516_1_plen_52_part_01
MNALVCKGLVGGLFRGLVHPTAGRTSDSKRRTMCRRMRIRSSDADEASIRLS